VQTHLLRSLDFLALTLRREPGVDVVFWTVHNALLDLRHDQLPDHRWLLRPKQLAHRTLYRAGGRMVDGFIAVSDDVAASIRSAYHPPRQRLAVIPNGVDVDRYGDDVDRPAVRAGVGIGADDVMAIVVAKLMTQKGHAVLIDALATLRDRLPRLHLLLVGEGSLRPELEASVRDRGLAKRVTFAGNRADIPELLAASDVFVLPSLWEGLPMALLEAMASRLPVVATSVSGTRQVVVDDESGLLVPPGNSDALAAAIERVVTEPKLAESLGHAARRRVEDWYSARAQARHHAELYRTRIAKREGEWIDP
jgi:glycosyltransferase involved in cell wall biosynthesis